MRWSWLAVVVTGCSFSGAGSDDGNSDVDAGQVDSGDVDAPDGGRTDWFDAAYGARRRISFDNSGRAALAGFPVALRFDGSDAARMGAAGEQLRFRDASDTIDLSFEVEQMGAEALVWVRVDVSENFTTDFLMYYDNPSAPVLSDGAATFAGAAGVFHFADSFGAADPVDDATGQNSLTDVTSVTSAANVSTGVLGPALEVGSQSTEALGTNGVANDFIVGDSQALTFETWFKTPSLTETRAIFDGTENCQGAALFISAGGNFVNGGLVGVLRAGNNCGVGNIQDFVATTDFMVDDDQWHHAALVVDRGAAQTVTLYVDGEVADTSNNVRQTGGTSDDPTRFANSNANNESFNGQLDELRVGPARPIDWFQATVANITVDSTVTVGAEELY